MNGTVTPILAGFLIGLVAGFPGGMLFARVRRGWSDVSSAKAGVPKARRSAWTVTRQAIILGLLLALAAAAMLGAHRNRTEPGRHAAPAPSTPFPAHERLQ
jgi:hypothetical protein